MFVYSQLTVELYEMLEAVNRKVEHLRFMDPISDFLYPYINLLPNRSLSRYHLQNVAQLTVAKLAGRSI